MALLWPFFFVLISLGFVTSKAPPLRGTSKGDDSQNTDEQEVEISTDHVVARKIQQVISKLDPMSSRGSNGRRPALNRAPTHSQTRSSGPKDNDDDDIYSLVHFKEDMYRDMDDLVARLNQSAHDNTASTKERLHELETELGGLKEQNAQLVEKVAGLYPARYGDLRLLGGKTGVARSNSRGFLQIYTGSTWGFVCDDFFLENQNASNVACRQLGYSDSIVKELYQPSDALEPGDLYWSREYAIVLDDVMCTGDEVELMDCWHSEIGDHDCSHAELVYLSCQ